MWEQVGDLVTVPDVVGLAFHVGRARGQDHGVTLANPDPDGPPVGALAWPGLFYILSQRPAAGAVVTRHSSVYVELSEHGIANPGAVRPDADVPPADSAHAIADREQILDLNEPNT